MSIDVSVSQLMTPSVITVAPDTKIARIAQLLWENNISTVPVVENGRVIGIITDYDLISMQSEYEAPVYMPFIDLYLQLTGAQDQDQLRRILATSARELMSYPVRSVLPTDDLQDVATVLYENRINALPVVDEEDRLVGIVTRADIVGLMAREEALHAMDSESDS